MLRKLGFVLACLVAVAAHADGELEINQICAVQTGCFPGDTAGFPVEIGVLTGASSFRLTGDLRVPDENTTAISITGVRATIDLGGFSITGVTTCSVDPVTATLTCAPVGSGVGILEAGFGVVARNGLIASMGSHGIQARGLCVVREMAILGNGGSGVSAGFECTIEGNQITANTRDGVSLLGADSDISIAPTGGGFSRVRGNTFTNNGRDGVAVNFASQIENNLFLSNDRYGLNSFLSVTYSGNLFFQNVVGAVRGLAGPPVNLGGNFCQGTGTTASTCP